MDEEEKAWLIAAIVLGLLASSTTLYQVFISPLFEPTFHLFVFQVPALISLASWLYIRLSRKSRGKYEVDTPSVYHGASEEARD